MGETIVLWRDILEGGRGGREGGEGGRKGGREGRREGGKERDEPLSNNKASALDTSSESCGLQEE